MIVLVVETIGAAAAAVAVADSAVAAAAVGCPRQCSIVAVAAVELVAAVDVELVAVAELQVRGSERQRPQRPAQGSVTMECEHLIQALIAAVKSQELLVSQQRVVSEWELTLPVVSSLPSC